MSFKLLNTENKARRGELKTEHGTLQTPFFMVVGTQAVIKGGLNAQDIEDLLPQLKPRAEELAALAVDKLKKRGEREEKDLREILERQRKRVGEELAKHENNKQLPLDFGEEEKRQFESNKRSWRTRLEQFDLDLEQEPQRVRSFYEVRVKRIEPVGLVYLWPETN